MVIGMAEDSKKKDNAFSKAIGDLRASRENIIKKQAVEELRKKQHEEEEYQTWLRKAEEILVEDCIEAIGTITAEQIVEMTDGSVTFISEAFIWFRDNRNTTLYRMKRLFELSQMERKQIIRDNRISTFMAQNERERRIEQNIISYTWGDDKLRRIFEKISIQLDEWNFDLKTKDGVEFVLRWSSK